MSKCNFDIGLTYFHPRQPSSLVFLKRFWGTDPFRNLLKTMRPRHEASYTFVISPCDSAMHISAN